MSTASIDRGVSNAQPIGTGETSPSTAELGNASPNNASPSNASPSNASPRDAANWFEIPSTDFNRAVTFYEKLLGISLRREAAEGEMAIFPCWPTGVGGSVVCRAWHKPAAAGSIIYLNADGVLQQAVARTKELGGSVMVPVTEVPGGFGSFACIIDTEGNQIGLHAH